MILLTCFYTSCVVIFQTGVKWAARVCYLHTVVSARCDKANEVLCAGV